MYATCVFILLTCLICLHVDGMPGIDHENEIHRVVRYVDAQKSAGGTIFKPMGMGPSGLSGKI